jgi:hypothetical protein
VRNFSSFILFAFLPCFCQTDLKGELKGTFPKDKYVISGNILVRPGDTLIFEAGSELTFLPMTGIQIKGAFFANGTRENAIVFSCEKSIAQSSNTKDSSPSNWNGIQVEDSTASLRLSYSMMCDASIAINIKHPARAIIFDQVVFHKNGLINLVKHGKPVGLKDDAEYVYSGTGKEMITVVDKSDEPARIRGSNGRKSGPKTPWYVPVRISFSVIGLVGAGLWLGGHLFADEYDQQYYREKTTKGAVSFRQKRDDMVTMQNIGMTMCGVGAGCFSITFIF